MGSNPDRIRIAWGPIQTSCGLYGARYGPHADCIGPDTGPARMMETDTGPIRIAWVSKQIPYVLHQDRYSHHTDCI
eukprot:9490551-Pyramimonas_sp.AAC.2